MTNLKSADLTATAATEVEGAAASENRLWRELPKTALAFEAHFATEVDYRASPTRGKARRQEPARPGGDGSRKPTAVSAHDVEHAGRGGVVEGRRAQDVHWMKSHNQVAKNLSIPSLNLSYAYSPSATSGRTRSIA